MIPSAKRSLPAFVFSAFGVAQCAGLQEQIQNAITTMELRHPQTPKWRPAERLSMMLRRSDRSDDLIDSTLHCEELCGCCICRRAEVATVSFWWRNQPLKTLASLAPNLL